jgi:hypothetical protein
MYRHMGITRSRKSRSKAKTHMHGLPKAIVHMHVYARAWTAIPSWIFNRLRRIGKSSVHDTTSPWPCETALWLRRLSYTRRRVRRGVDHSG